MLRVAVVVIGFVLLAEVFLSYCKKRLNENYAFAWGVFAVVLVICGAVPALSGWSRALASQTSVFYVIMGICIVWLLFTMSVNLSSLSARNQELAIQVSILNTEMERVLKMYKKETGKDLMEPEK
ncbi:MAG: DUF2304 domain-containing protein [Lachnospiraceae bacterium]|nr:DUF2304 domain-containing protein [Lachnospiraceae bacterium]